MMGTEQTEKTREQSEKIRILCKDTGRLVATMNEFELTIWCKYTKKPEVITWEEFDAYREKCRSASTSKSA